ncbi:M23 family metallopeptidase [Actinacidiphila glaucinigra]|uniref:M23 family metallopeptidase n=1 Tax=Actinacidiphila glaucinigra TaxID=235986 RepID=UPI002E2FBAAB|nr:M23 family metallopeptidase [Actinacidiphila glaucinigra]
MASNEPALIPGQQQGSATAYSEWDTAEWNIAAGWNPPAAEQAPPTKNAIDGWDTGQWNMAAGWLDAAAAVETASPDAGAAQPEAAGPEAYEAPAALPRQEDIEAFGSTRDAEGVPREDPQAEPWNPTEESPGPRRARHRVAKQRSMGRGSAVFGVAAVAVLGVGGVATAEGKNPLPVSLPHLPDASQLPGIGALVEDDSAPEAKQVAEALSPDAGEALRNRILDQAQQQRTAADRAARTAAQQEASAKAAKSAAQERVRAEAAAKKKAAAEAAKKIEAERLAALAKSFVKPVSSYTLTAGFGESSSLWANTHTGQDFAAPTGTPVKAIHSGTITEAGWAGSYGYRIILTLDDGTELWYCHLSSMIVTSGKVDTGDTIGRVGATGNVTGPHLHLEVRPGGGDPIGPMGWLRSKGLSV